MKKHVIEIFQKKKEIATPDETKFIFRSGFSYIFGRKYLLHIVKNT